MFTDYLKRNGLTTIKIHWATGTTSVKVVPINSHAPREYLKNLRLEKLEAEGVRDSIRGLYMTDQEISELKASAPQP